MNPKTPSLHSLACVSKALLLLILVAIAPLSHAQTCRGTFLPGANLSFNFGTIDPSSFQTATRVKIVPATSKTALFCDAGIKDTFYGTMVMGGPVSTGTNPPIYATTIPGLGYSVKVTYTHRNASWYFPTYANALPIVECANRNNCPVAQGQMEYAVTLHRYQAIGHGTMSGYIAQFNSSLYANATVLSATARVGEPTCEVSIGSQNQTIPLGDVRTTDFPNAGSGSAWSQFDVRLQNCNASTTGASFIFGGTADPVNSSLFRLSQSSGVATGLAVNIRRRNTANDIAPNTADVWTSIPENRMFEYSARYVRPGGAPVTSGIAPAFATITLTYR